MFAAHLAEWLTTQSTTEHLQTLALQLSKADKSGEEVINMSLVLPITAVKTLAECSAYISYYS